MSVDSYDEQNGMTYRITDKGERELLANFIARIEKEVRYVDGRTTETILTITGEKPNPAKDATELTKLPPVEVSAEQFGNLSWVLPNWGVQAVIRPGSSVRDDLRTAIQLFSNPKLETVYKHIGWNKVSGQPAYIHAGGAITKKGNDKTVATRLPSELSRYKLTSEATPIEGIQAALQLIGLTDSSVTWPLLAGSLAPLFGPVDFAIHLTGRTGTFKSEIMSLFQSLYGSEMDARHLPGSWSSTGNALEAQAFLAANAPFVIDDFVPTGSTWQQRAYQTTADKIMRSQGNQSGRARLTDTSNLQTAMYPRGIVLSTGEDTPEGHSVRARMLILELSPGDIDPATLTKCQANRAKLPALTAALAQHIASEGGPSGIEMKPYIDSIRAKNLTIGHTRTPGMLARLIAVIEYFLDWAELVHGIQLKQAQTMKKQAAEAILQAGNRQNQYLEATDPTDLFLQAIRQVLASGGGHLRSLNGGIPVNAEQLGWTSEKSMGEMPTWKSRGPCIGWVNWQEDSLMLDMVGGYNIVRKAGGSEITLTKQTLIKRLKDAGKLNKVDDPRQRNTIRIVAEQHPRTVIALYLSQALDTQEKPNE